ncbi:MAG: sialidase family protein [Actinomycetota bacterium]
MRNRPRSRRNLLIWLCLSVGLLAVALPSTAQLPEEEPEFVGAAFNTTAETFEPTLGVDPAGNLYFAQADSTGGVAIGFKAGTFKSIDGGATWTDISPKVGGRNIPPETNDPYIYVDQKTGRVFQFHMSPILTCSIMSFTDNGGTSWTTNPAGCFPTVVWDHQTMVSATPRVLTPVGYPNILHQCVNAVYAAMCSRSIDGGLTWQPPTVVHANEDIGKLQGAQHGHLAAAPDGTLYLPTALGGDFPTVYVSRDDGLTWTKRTIANIDTPWTDPSIAVDALGNAYASFVDEDGKLYISVSKDNGTTWSPAIVATTGIVATMPVITVGDPGRIAIAYPGTDDLPDGWDTDPAPAATDVAWYPYFTVSFNALDANPTFTSLSATGTDPIERRYACVKGGRCGYQVDFIDAVMGPNGLPYAAFADGCTSAGCISNPSTNNNEGGTGKGVVTTIVKSPMKWCEARCARYGPVPSA